MIINTMTDLGPDLRTFTEGAKFIVNNLIAKNQKKIKGLQRLRRGQSLAQSQYQLHIYHFWHAIFLNAAKIVVLS